MLVGKAQEGSLARQPSGTVFIALRPRMGAMLATGTHCDIGATMAPVGLPMQPRMGLHARAADLSMEDKPPAPSTMAACSDIYCGLPMLAQALHGAPRAVGTSAPPPRRSRGTPRRRTTARGAPHLGLPTSDMLATSPPGTRLTQNDDGSRAAWRTPLADPTQAFQPRRAARDCCRPHCLWGLASATANAGRRPAISVC